MSVDCFIDTNVFYSEDLQHDRRIGDLRIVNPFGWPPRLMEANDLV